jgi:hypothetical protein
MLVVSKSVAHGVHSAEPASEYVFPVQDDLFAPPGHLDPAGQGVQPVTPATEYVPGPHGLHWPAKAIPPPAGYIGRLKP